MVPGARVNIKRLHVNNAGWEFEEIDPADTSHPEALTIRGYRLRKLEARELVFDRPGVYTIDEVPPVHLQAAAGAAAMLVAVMAGVVLLSRKL